MVLRIFIIVQPKKGRSGISTGKPSLGITLTIEFIFRVIPKGLTVLFATKPSWYNNDKDD